MRQSKIFGNSVELRPVIQNDFELFFRWFNDPEIYLWWGGKPIDPETIQQKYLGLRRPQVDGYIIEVTGMSIGYAQSHRTGDNKGSIDSFLVPSMRGRGYGGDAVEALIEHLTQVEGWKQIAVDPERDNIPAQSFWQKMGFTTTEQTTSGANLLLIFGPPHQSSDGPGR